MQATAFFYFPRAPPGLVFVHSKIQISEVNMKNYRDSDYAANKYAGGIVYRFADKTVEVTLADYLRENPDKTETDFAELKALSDEMYFRQDRADNAQSKKLVSLHALEETELCAALSIEDELAETERRAERLKVAAQCLDTLTPVQRRRYLLHVVDGLTTRKIAEQECVSHVAVVYSLEWAEKKIKKVFENGKK
jgi:DNA-directed RNA polymerase specialized sigma24 family protein